jgi:MFS family permease
MSIWSAGSAIGIALGFAGGGLLAASLGWRVAFFASAAPGIVFAILAFRLREPLRGKPRKVDRASNGLATSLQMALLIVSPALLLVAAGLACLALGSIQADTSAMDQQWSEREVAASGSAR